MLLPFQLHRLDAMMQQGEARSWDDLLLRIIDTHIMMLNTLERRTRSSERPRLTLREPIATPLQRIEKLEYFIARATLVRSPISPMERPYP
jgi:hypothetical protein